MSFLSLWIASLIGSPHCVGMCGGFAGYISGRFAHKWAAQVLYHGARLTTYAGLGALAGGLGHAVDDAGWRLGVERVAALGVALLLIAQALVLLLGRRGGSARFFFPIHQKVTRVWGKISQHSGLWTAPVLGILTAFLPCGWLYSFVVLAMAAGGAVEGAWMLLVFGLGTLPALVLLGSLVRALVQKTGIAPSMVTLLLLLGAGGFSLGQHLGVFPGWFSPIGHVSKKSCH